MEPVLRSREFFRFNTTNTISAFTDDESALDDAVALCDRYEFLFSRVAEDSELHRLNNARGKATEVDDELAAFIAESLRYCRETDGLFDITMGSATQLWNFKEQIIPTKKAMKEALAHVDYRRIDVKGNMVALNDPAACIDLGGIAKGYIADGLLALLKSRGIERALVNLGGNVAVMGGKPGNVPWCVGIRKPFPSNTLSALDSFAAVSLTDGSVVTSGIYERAFQNDRGFFHHILDPRTGFPAETDLLGATVVSKTSLDGDGYTTALILMGADRAIEFAENHPSIEAILVTKEGDVLATSAIGKEIPFELLG